MSGGIKSLLAILGGGILLLLVLLALLGGGPFVTDSMMGPGGMMMGNRGQGWPGGVMDGGWGVLGLAWMLVPLLFWGGLVAVIAWAVARMTTSRHGGGVDLGPGEQSAEEILRRRFARGEINAEEYEQRRSTLSESSREAPK